MITFSRLKQSALSSIMLLAAVLCKLGKLGSILIVALLYISCIYQADVI